MTIYSHFRLSTFENCPLAFKLGYIDRIKREEEGVEAFVGSRFHETMEVLYKELKFKTCTLKDLLDFSVRDGDVPQGGRLMVHKYL